jgi:pectate lyase-like protein
MSRRVFIGRTLLWSGSVTGATLVGSLVIPPFEALAAPAGGRRRSTVLNVKDRPYGARGDGLSDDGPAIQAALDDAAQAGGGVVYLPPGTYRLRSVQEQTGVRYFLLNYGSGVSMVGAGRDKTVLMAPAGMPDQARIISADSADGRVRVSRAAFRDFTIDGNAANQPYARSCVGISNVHTDQIEHLRVRILGVKGTADAESTCFDSFYSTNTSYRDCEARQRPGEPTGSGFSATHSQRIAYEHCQSSGSAHWQGFTTYLSQQVDYLDCHGYLNGQRGLNCERSADVRLINCRAGGPTMGNRGDGIFVFKSQNVEIVDCVSQGNQSGFVNVGSTVRLVGGQFVANTSAGLVFGSVDDRNNSSLDAPLVAANGLLNVAVAGRPAA